MPTWPPPARPGHLRSLARRFPCPPAGPAARLALRIAAAAILALITARSGASAPAIAGVIAGIAVWLTLTSRGDLAPPPGR